MKMSQYAVIALSVMANVSMGAEKEKHVTDVASLVSAINEAEAGTTIYLAPRVYDLGTVSAMHANGHLAITKTLTFVGENDASWRSSATRETGAILKGSGNRIMRCEAKVTARHITFMNGSSGQAAAGYWDTAQHAPEFTNCVFRSNGSTGGNAAINRGIARDCLFEKNTAVTFAGAANECTSYNCVFDSNQAGQGGALVNSSAYNCVFTNNVANQADARGGAIWDQGGDKYVYEHCLFVNNRVLGTNAKGGAIHTSVSVARIDDCEFRGNSSSSFGGAIFPESSVNALLITNCTFVANKAQSAGALYYCKNVIDCDFANNTNDYFSAHCWHSILKNCRITGEGQMCQSTLTDCIFTNAHCSNAQAPGVVVAVENSVQDVPAALYNCLFVGCNGGYLFRNQGSRLKVVNCTVADSTITLAVLDNAKYSSSYPRTEVLNSLFAGVSNGSRDVGFQAVNTAGEGCLVCSNNAATVLSIPASTESFPVVSGGNAQGKIVFYGTRKSDGVPPYTPRYSSVSLGVGALLDWTDEDRDLAGNPRVINGRVDAGCYQTCYSRPGLTLCVH